jgi:hypothetical protein
MTYLAACLVVILCAAGAAAASFVVGRTVAIDTRQRHHEVGFQIFLQLGVMFSVLLAFVFSEVWGEYNTAAQSINAECGALHGAAMLANALPNGAGRPVNRAILVYARTVVDQEWPQMAERRWSGQAAQDFRAALDVAARMQAPGPSEASIKSQVLVLLSQAHAARETRTFQITQCLPTAMWIVLIVLSLFLIGFVLCAGLEAPGRMIFASLFTGGTVMVLVLVRMLDFPFEGAMTLANADFVKTIAEVSSLVAGD